MNSIFWKKDFFQKVNYNTLENSFIKKVISILVVLKMVKLMVKV
jgi:hypothetical protein